MELPCLDEFLTSVLVEKSGSKHTQLSYARDLGLFSEFLQKTNSRVEGFAQSKLTTYCVAKNLSKRSQARVVSTLRSYFKYLQRLGKIRQTPKLEITEHVRPLPDTLGKEEIEKLMESAAASEQNANRALRNKLVLNLFIATGVRVSEMCDLNISDLQLDTRTLTVKGKGSKKRMVPLVSWAMKAVNEYLDIRINMASPIEKSLIVNDRGNRPSRIDIFRWLKRWSTQSGFAKNVSPHTLRHTCATLLLREGVDLRSIQTLLGHASISTTEIYTRVENRDLVETIDKFHPLSE